MVLSYGHILEFDEPATLANNAESEFAQILKQVEKDEQDRVGIL